ncbi:ribose 1,5-bisphosphate isomerase [Methanoculleus sp. MH98A]|uniref:ribose 1,5-bisphosphate isomerase n=1 Tax=Methanoculleus sp. MH98A TaxID=1495314 RepID=UPI00049F8F2D|nr:ribose 1,5-bisphosphate isomerase [Methanoculleus sp. MH98A]KDE56253.1 translation initiation factor IF-2B subunit delta [Methanoculleus sp. MH98A]
MVLSETAASIKSMEIRGAGRIARAAVEALADYAANLDVSDPETFKQEMQKAADILTATRPTAVSLPNAVRSVMRALDSFDSVEAARDAVLARAAEFVDHSEHAVERIAAIGARHISDGDVLLTHCNSEAALGCILEAHRQGKELEVYATEVRPRGQGLITIRTLNDAGIRTNYIVDSAVRYFINDVDLVVVGADAIAVNGAVVNKIGTAQIAHAAHEARTNVIVAAETYKFAPRTILGDLIEIEERDPDEVLPRAVAEELPFVRVRNPAFDVTPAEYVDLIVTEQGAIPPGLAFTVIRDFLGWKIEELR